MEAPNSKKRLRQEPCVSSPTDQIQNPNSLLNVPDFNLNNVDLILSSFLSLPDSLGLYWPDSIDDAFDRALDKLFEAHGDDESVQDNLADRTHFLATLLQRSTKRRSRLRDTLRNSNSWSLPHELTIKVFSMLDTKTLVRASVSCTMFKKCAMDSLCYSHIDLTSGYIDDKVVRRMIRHAGKELRSLKVGCSDEFTTSFITGACLSPLSYNHGFTGGLLRSLHIYNNRWLDNDSLRGVLLDCSNLTDFKIVGLNVDSLDDVLDILPRKCEQLFIEREIGSGRSGSLDVRVFEIICPNITSLSLIGFDLDDRDAYDLIMGLHKLKYMNLSRTVGIDGSFLRDVRNKDILLETLILRDCFNVEERNVCRFLYSLLRGYLRCIRHIDVSSQGGILCRRGRRSSRPKFPVEELEEELPGLTFVADFASSSPYSTASSSGYASY